MTRAELEAMAAAFVRSNECEVLDDYVAHEDTFIAGFLAGRDAAAATLPNDLILVASQDAEHEYLKEVLEQIKALGEE